MSVRIVFIGAGRMATALVQGLLKNRFYLPEEIACTCGNDSSGPALAEKTGIHFYPEIAPILHEAKTIVLACKPQQFSEVDDHIVNAAGDKLIISILAGTTLATLKAKFHAARNVVRTMPNTPGQIGAGVTAYAPLDPLSEEIHRTLMRLFVATGRRELALKQYELCQAQLVRDLGVEPENILFDDFGG